MNKFSTPFMAKSPLNKNGYDKEAAEAGRVVSATREKTKKEKLEEKIEETRKKAYIRSKSSSEDFESSPGEGKAQKKLKRLNKRLAKKEQK